MCIRDRPYPQRKCNTEGKNPPFFSQSFQGGHLKKRYRPPKRFYKTASPMCLPFLPCPLTRRKTTGPTGARRRSLWSSGRLLRQSGGDDGHGAAPQNVSILRVPFGISLLGAARPPLRQVFASGKTLVPVSYTHLYVYKGQTASWQNTTIWRGWPPCSSSRGIRSPASSWSL